jgi:hypothetical protein
MEGDHSITCTTWRRALASASRVTRWSSGSRRTTHLAPHHSSATWHFLARALPVRRVLLTKVRRGTRSRREARDVLTELDYPVMDTEIPLAEWPYAVSFGTSPSEFGAYDDLLAELKS